MRALAIKTPAEAPPKDPGPWEDSASAIHFTAVKKDVLVSSDLRLAPEALVKKLVANAVEKI